MKFILILCFCALAFAESIESRNKELRRTNEVLLETLRELAVGEDTYTDVMNDESALASAQKYTVQSSGKCQTMDGKDPKYKFYGGEANCEDRCNKDSNCYGYSKSNSNNCLIWTQRDIRGGGNQWGGANCHIKNISPNTYTVHSNGKCQTMDGKDPKYKYYGGEPKCEDRCNNDANCYGYSLSRYNNCLIWTQSDIKGRGNAWAGAGCHIKNLGQVYTTHTSGKCQTLDGKDPKYKYYGTAPDCEERCNKDSNCYGYSLSRYNNCLLWTQRDIKGGGNQWAGADCHIKGTELAVGEIEG